MTPDDIAAAIRHAGGCARTSTLLNSGATEENLLSARRAETVLRPRKGIYVVPETPEPVVEAALHGGALTCASLLYLRGIWVLDGHDDVHVWLGSRGRARPHDGCRCVAHWSSGSGGVGAVPLHMALAQILSCRGDEAFFAAFESAWNKGMLGAEDRQAVRSRIPARKRWLVDFAHGESDSGLESLVRLRLHLLGIRVEAQVWIDDVGLVDFLIDGCIILEIDGRENHDGPSKRHKDLRRDAAAAARGYTALRFDYALVTYDWPVVEAAIIGARASRRGGRRPVLSEVA
ncbi:MAG: endonuclease domain-containing protein [Candidatus Microbacterium stercoravium]|uniref:endonuclease domain-containing protein n=2 Tax=Microbacteriaceae TaxID=85023 RepID=UPI0004050C1E|nr:DUF559 domain-containing protein [Microbacterium gubbeenense]